MKRAQLTTTGCPGLGLPLSITVSIICCILRFFFLFLIRPPSHWVLAVDHLSTLPSSFAVSNWFLKLEITCYTSANPTLFHKSLFNIFLRIFSPTPVSSIPVLLRRNILAFRANRRHFFISSSLYIKFDKIGRIFTQLQAHCVEVNGYKPRYAKSLRRYCHSRPTNVDQEV